MRIHLEGFGFASPDRIQQEQIDVKTTRPVPGTGGPLLPVPGLLELHKVQVPGLVLEDRIAMDMPLDPQCTRFLSIDTECVRLIHGVGGEPLLERSRFSNDGIFQAGETFYVSGLWNEEVSPVPSEPLARPEPARRPVLTGGGVEESAETRGARTRMVTKESSDAKE